MKLFKLKMDYTLLCKILMKWSLENKEYELTNFIYNEFNIGIPVSYLYKLPTQMYFSSMDNFFNNSDNKKSDDKHLDRLLSTFSKSKYGPLIEWNGKYGYKKY